MQIFRSQLSFDDVKLKMEGEGTFEGYASKFGGTDTHGDTILAGAFASTLRQNGKPKMFFNHDWKMPIGKFDTVKEDDNGLFVRGQLTPGHALAQDIHAAMKHGTMDGLSIGGFVKRGDVEDRVDGKGQIVKKFTRLLDISVVPFPSDANARIDTATVRGEDLDDVIADIETIREFERFLRDAGGLSKEEALAVVSKAKALFSAPGDLVTKAADADKQRLFDRLDRITGRG